MPHLKANVKVFVKSSVEDFGRKAEYQCETSLKNVRTGEEKEHKVECSVKAGEHFEKARMVANVEMKVDGRDPDTFETSILFYESDSSGSSFNPATDSLRFNLTFPYERDIIKFLNIEWWKEPSRVLRFRWNGGAGVDAGFVVITYTW